MELRPGVMCVQVLNFELRLDIVPFLWSFLSMYLLQLEESLRVRIFTFVS